MCKWLVASWVVGLAATVIPASIVLTLGIGVLLLIAITASLIAALVTACGWLFSE